MDSHTYTDRIKQPWYKKINPIWWFQNDTEQQLPDWYRPGDSYTKRYIYWNVLRNPLQNFRAFIIGVQDHNYTVYGRSPVLTVQRNDLVPPEKGLQWTIILLAGWFPLPFLSYSFSTRVTWYIGWQPNGFFGLKINF